MITQLIQRIDQRIERIGMLPGDSELDIKRKSFQIAYTLVLVFWSIEWGILNSVYLKIPEASAPPIAHAVLSCINIALFARHKKFLPFSYFQTFISIMMPFLLQWHMGGLLASGCAMIWALVTLAACVTYSSLKATVFWLFFFITLLLVYGKFDPLFYSWHSVNYNPRFSYLMISINFGTAASIIALYAYDYDRERNKSYAKLEEERRVSENLLLNILPKEVAEELKEKGNAQARRFEEATVLFTDFKGFTALSERLSPEELVEEINTCFTAFDLIMKERGVEKIKTIGDAYMAVGGIPTPSVDHATNVVLAALDIQSYMEEYQKKRKQEGKEYFEIRIGVHTGPLVAGVVALNKFAYDVWGDTVNTASRMESSSEPGKINISGSTYSLIKDKFPTSYRGKVAAKGKGEIDMYFLEG